MDWRVLAVFVVAMSPWVGLVVMIVIHGHLTARVSALEEKMTALTGELGWKE